MDSYQSRVRSIAEIPMPSIPKLSHRANDIFNAAIGEYNFLKTQLKPDQSINLVCYISGGVFDVFSVSSHEHYIEVRAKDEHDNIHIITAPIEQIAFDIILSKKVNDEPPREIGFHAMREAESKKA